MADKPAGLVIFDLDGTLFRAETACVPAIRQAFSEMGLPIPERAAILALFGRPAGEYQAWLRGQCPPDKAGELVARVDRLEIRFVVEQGELYAGVLDALAEIRALGSQMALCTNGPSAYVEPILAAQGLAPFFDRVRCWRMDGEDKAGMVGELLAALPHRPAAVVGDRADDVAAAHRHGAVAVGAAYGYGSRQELAGADVVVASPAELPRAICRLLGCRDESDTTDYG